jgi:hypothetical protein
MTLLESGKFGFIINGLTSTVQNYSLSIFDSAPADIGNIRFKIHSALTSSSIDLNFETNTSLDLSITPYGGSPLVTNITFNLANNYNLIPESGSVVKEANSYRYEVSTTLNAGQESIFKFEIVPKNPQVAFQIPITVSTDQFSEAQSLSFDVIGPNEPNVVITVDSIPKIYNNLFSTYNLTVKYVFEGGSPSTNATMEISSSFGSIERKFVQLDFLNLYPNNDYSIDLILSTADYDGDSEELTVSLNYDDLSVDSTVSIDVNPVTIAEIFEVSLINAPVLSETGGSQDIEYNISVQSLVDLSIDSMQIIIDDSNNDYSIVPSSINLGGFSGNQQKFFTVTVTFSSELSLSSRVYNIPIKLTYFTSEIDSELQIDTDYIPPVTTTSSDTTSPTTSESAPPTPGFEIIIVFSTFSLLTIVYKRKKG